MTYKKRVEDLLKPMFDSWASLADAYAEEVVLDSISGDISIYLNEATTQIINLIEEAEGKKLELLEDYTNFLHKEGYIDSDYYTDEPTAINRYLAELKNK